MAVVYILRQTFDTGLGVDALALCFELGDGGVKHHGVSVGIFAPLQSLGDFNFDAFDETCFSLRQLEDGAFAAAANGCTRCLFEIAIGAAKLKMFVGASEIARSRRASS